MSGSSEKQQQQHHHLGSGVDVGVKPILRVVDMTTSSASNNNNNNNNNNSTATSAKTVPVPPPPQPPVLSTATSSSSGTTATCNSNSNSNILRRASMNVTALRPDFSKISSSPPSAITTNTTNTASTAALAVNVNATATQIVNNTGNASTPRTTKPTISMKDIVPANQPDTPSILLKNHPHPNRHHHHPPTTAATNVPPTPPPPPKATISKSGKEAIAALLSSCITKRGRSSVTTTGTMATTITTATRTTSLEGIPTTKPTTKPHNNNNNTNTKNTDKRTTGGKRRRPSFAPLITEHQNSLDLNLNSSEKHPQQHDKDSPPFQRKRIVNIVAAGRRKSCHSTSSQIRRHNSINFDNLMGYRSGSDSSSLQSSNGAGGGGGGGLSSGNNSFGNLQNSTFATIGGNGGGSAGGSTNHHNANNGGGGPHNVLLHNHLTNRRMNSNNSHSQGMMGGSGGGGGGEIPKLSAFPFSAPRFTPEDERKELESMTADEKQQATDDMRGTISSSSSHNHKTKIVETPPLIRQKKEELQRALQLVAPLEKLVYTEALDKCPPEVWEKECEPLRFLRAEQFDVPQAAKRICAYWQYRKKIFGPTKAFEPMTLSGCMSEDLEAIIARWDFTHLCPPDEKGRTVFYMDRSRRGYASEGISNSGLLRLLWYVSHVALEREDTQKNGVVLIIMFKLPSHAHFDRKTAKANFGSFRDALPVRVQAVHMLHMPEYMRHLFPVIKNLMGKHMRARMKIHNGSEYSVLSTLSGEFAFSPKHLPISMGGEYDHDTLGFIAERERVEGCSVLAVSPVPAAGPETAAATIETAAAAAAETEEDPSEPITEKVSKSEEETTKSETPQVVVVVEEKRDSHEGDNHEIS